MEFEQASVPGAREKLDISSDLNEQTKVRDFVRDFCANYMHLNPDKRLVWQLELAVNEALTNIIEHSYSGRDDQKIQIEADAFEDRIVFRLHHWGEFFEPPPVIQRPPLDGSHDRGFGLFLMYKCVDEINYFQDKDGTNVICLVKRSK